MPNRITCFNLSILFASEINIEEYSNKFNIKEDSNKFGH